MISRKYIKKSKQEKYKIIKNNSLSIHMTIDRLKRENNIVIIFTFKILGCLINLFLSVK